MRRRAGAAERGEKGEKDKEGGANDDDDDVAFDSNTSGDGRNGNGRGSSTGGGSPPRNTFRRNLEFEEKPRSFILGGVALCTIMGISFYADDYTPFHRRSIQRKLKDLSEEDLGFYMKMVGTGLVVGNMIYCILMSRDSKFTHRPHPAFWRGIHGGALSYFYLLVLLAILPVDTGRDVIRLVSPKHEGANTTTPATETPAAQASGDTLGNWHLACEISPATLKRQVTSLWFIAHIIGWWAKMCVIRDFSLCLAYSVMFECMELTFQNLIPEFQECWWDSVILDVLGANMLGLYLGWVTIRYLNCRVYHWKSFATIRGVRQKTVRVLQQFLPYAWSEYRWNTKCTTRQYVAQHMGWIVGMAVELNSFFLMNGLDIKPSHPSMCLRQVMLALLCVPAMAEYYEATRISSSPSNVHHQLRFGQNLWLFVMIACLEGFVCLKYVLNSEILKRSKEVPIDIICAWLSFFCIQGLYLGINSVSRKRSQYPKWVQKLKFHSWVQPLKFLSFIPLCLTLSRYYAY